VSRSLSEKELSSINHVGEMEEKHCASLASRIFHFENPNKGTNMVFFVCCVDLNKNTEKISKPQPGLGRLSIPRGVASEFDYFAYNSKIVELYQKMKRTGQPSQFCFCLGKR
jgi:hypothetical protein